MKKGILLAFEGAEGAGKTTQVQKLFDKMVALGKDVLMVREPGGTKIGEQIRDVVLDKNNFNMMDTTEVLLYQASRAQLYAEVIKPALAVGRLVLMDRTADSSLVYQGMARGMGVELIRSFNSFSTLGIQPDLIILLDVDARLGLSRLDEKKRDRLENEGIEFHEKVRAGYLDLFKADLDRRWIKIDASRDEQSVEKEVDEMVASFFVEKNSP